MWYSFIDGRVVLVLVLIAMMWVVYFSSDEYARRKAGGYGADDMCLICGEHISDPHAIGCDCEDM